MNQTNARRVRRALTAPALIGAAACTLGAPQPAHADAAAPDWLVTAEAQPAKRMRVVEGLTVHPLREEKVLPLRGYHLTARFGNTGSLWSSDHTGLDFAAAEGTPLVAIGDGVVTEAGYDGAYGNKTVIRLEDGTELWYCHQSAQSVAVGEQVAAGEVIGAVGSTGNVTGPHLHLEVRVHDAPVDPESALADWGIRA